MAILSRGAVIGALVAGAALAPGAAVAHTPRADQAGASLRAELRGLVRMPDGPPGAIVVVQRAGGDGSTPPACPGSGPAADPGV